jgi:parallel beta-helix repeat protein
MQGYSLIRTVSVILTSFLTVGSAAAATVIHVPAGQPTIQMGINAASNGDTVLVAPGTYQENIDFLGKAIKVTSTNGSAVTTIKNNGGGSVVTFHSGEGLKSILNGFTITGGWASFGGGGIEISNASPTITNNKIIGNQACEGDGIDVNFGSPLIKGNTITGNSQFGCSGGTGGGGIKIGGAASAQVVGNLITNNDAGSGDGGGISLFAAGTPTIMNNIISNNSTQGGGFGGGGISMFNYSDAVIVQNLIFANSAPQGGGVYYLVPSGANGPTLVNNTFVNNQSSSGQGSAIYANDFDVPSHLYNNIIFGTGGQTAVYCGNLNSSTPPAFFFNDVFAAQGTTYGGICSDQTGTDGNVSTDPKFVGKSNFRLKDASPVIDAGDNSAPDLPSTDFAGNPRIIDSNGGSTAIVDMGAYEFDPLVLSPRSLNFGQQAVGSTTSKTVKLTNVQDKVLNISSLSAPTGYSVTGCGTSVAAFSSCPLTVTFHPLTIGSFAGTLTVKDDAGNSPQTVKLSGSAN